MGADFSVKGLVEHLQTTYGCSVKRLFPIGNDKVALFEDIQLEKLNWKIELQAGGKCMVEPEAVFSAWPQLRMAVQMLARVPEGAARKNFEGQIQKAADSLQGVKDTFQSRYDGPVGKAYIELARPKDEEAEKQKYF